MRPRPGELMDEAERNAEGSVLYLNEIFRRKVIAMLQKAYRQGVDAERGKGDG